MAMTTGPNAPLINITPLIDVLLVLLIIFLVITPTKSVGLATDVPQPALDSPQTEPVPSTVVLTIDKGGKLALNSEAVEAAALEDRLRQVFALRASKVLFLKGAGELEFASIAQLIDTAKGAGIVHVALMSNKP